MSGMLRLRQPRGVFELTWKTIECVFGGTSAVGYNGDSVASAQRETYRADNTVGHSCVCVVRMVQVMAKRQERQERHTSSTERIMYTVTSETRQCSFPVPGYCDADAETETKGVL